ncbi:hypothetical protein ACIPSA_44520 [Streptomyces sp. NPDC086549]|uniref:nSTAND1 domain-containing NTPase n=1 Tax=Streptomyces sp. NPDC086549 TaxID=3365752 RepID=UPI00382A3087
MAGRPESPLDPSAGPAQRFAAELRKLRAEAGSPTYRSMARRTGQGASTLSQAAAGERLPTLTVLLAYVRACGADETEWEGRWRQAAAQEAAEPRSREEEDPEPPYRGLTRFEPADAGSFFGRDQLTDRLLELTRSRRLTAVFGPSGSGKSSLLRAGLIPRLRDPERSGPRPAALRVLTPGEHPVRTHAERLVPKDMDGDTWLIVDQFEELFTLCADPVERDRFIDHLVAATDAESRLRVVIAVRADFLGRCAEHARLTAALQDGTVLAGPMSRDELREAIVKPAQSTGLIVERALTARILDDVEGEPGALPLMSHALLETWHRRKGRALGVEAYEGAGGLHGAIARTAEDIFAHLTPAQAGLARRILLRLVTPGEGTPDTRRPVPRTELDFGDLTDTETVLERLARARLLTLDHDTVDLAHEALIAAWPRLRDWVDTDREQLRRQRRLTEAAAGWEALGRDPGALYRGTRLDMAEEAFALADRRGELTRTEEEFLTESIDARDRERRGAARTTRRLRRLAAGLSVLLVLAVTAGLVAWQQNRASERRRVQATARRLADLAGTLRDSDPQTAMRLSVAAWHIADIAETRSALVDSLAQKDRDAFAPPDADRTDQDFLTDDGNTLVEVAETRITTWDVTTHRRTGVHPGTGRGETALALSPDGRRLALARHNRIVVQDLATGRRTPGPPRQPSDVAFGPSGHTLLLADQIREGGWFEVWDIARRRAVLEQHVPIFDLSSPPVLAPDDRHVAVCPSKSHVQLLTVPGHRTVPLAQSSARAASGECVTTFSPDGRRLTVATGADVLTWDTATGKLVGRFSGRDIVELRYSADGRTLAALGADQVWVWDQPAGQAQPRAGYPVQAQGASDLRPDRSGRWFRFVTADVDRPVMVRTVTGAPRPRADAPSDETWLSPDASLLATARPAGEQERFTFTGTGAGSHPDKTQALPVCPEAPTSTDGKMADGSSVNCNSLLAFSADSRTAVYTMADLNNSVAHQRLAVWHARGSRAATLNLPVDPPAAVEQIALGPDGRTLFVSLVDDTEERVDAWDLRSRTKRVLHRIGGGILAVRPDGQVLAASDGRYAELTSGHVAAMPLDTDLGDLESGGVASHDNTRDLTALTFSRDGTYLAAEQGQQRVLLLDGQMGKRLASLTPTSPADDSSAVATALAFSPDARTLAVSSPTVQLWDVAALRPMGSALTDPPDGDDPNDGVSTLAFSPDGRSLYAAGRHPPLQTLPASPDSVAQTVCRRARGGLSRQTWHRLIPELDYRGTC